MGNCQYRDHVSKEIRVWTLLGLRDSSLTERLQMNETLRPEKGKTSPNMTAQSHPVQEQQLILPLKQDKAVVITQLPESEATQRLGGALLATTNVEATPANTDSNRLQAQSRSQYTWHQKWDQIKTNDS